MFIWWTVKLSNAEPECVTVSRTPSDRLHCKQTFVGCCWPFVHSATVVAESIVLLTVMPVRGITVEPFSLSLGQYTDCGCRKVTDIKHLDNRDRKIQQRERKEARVRLCSDYQPKSIVWHDHIWKWFEMFQSISTDLYALATQIRFQSVFLCWKEASLV